jgi:hypothetical protein
VKKRTGLSPRLRFEVFKRDGFRCVYCGATPVDVPLHVDHVKPVADGGTDDPTNLVTACRSCNGGKSAVPLGDKRLGPSRTPDEARDHAEQILAYLDAERGVVAAKTAVRDEIAAAWTAEVGFSALPAERSYLARCAEEFGAAKVIDAVRAAVTRIGPQTDYQASKCYRYFCGIVRRWRETGDTTLGRPIDKPRDAPATPVEDLVRWIGGPDAGTVCEICACDNCSGHKRCGGNEEHDCAGCQNATVHPYRILNDGAGIQVSASNLVFLCGHCVADNLEVFRSVSSAAKCGLPGTARRWFFDRVARRETRELMDATMALRRAEGSVS